MFGMLESLAKAAAVVVTAPAGVIADAVTLGGVLTDRDKPYTAQALEDAMGNLRAATSPSK